MPDLLEEDKTSIPGPNVPDLYDLHNKELAVLQEIYRQLALPSVQLTCVLRFDNMRQWLTSGSDSCEVRFEYNAKRVKSRYTIISNSSDIQITINPNGPIQRGASSTDVAGLLLPTARPPLIIESELEYLTLGLDTTSTAFVVGVNNSLSPVPADGSISVYAFGVPHNDMYTTQ